MASIAIKKTVQIVALTAVQERCDGNRIVS